MEAKQVIFQELLNGARQYVVPLYQRTYSWEEKQWEQLWDDILDIYSMESPRNHFIGSVVTQQIHTAPEGLPMYTLIDGQTADDDAVHFTQRRTRARSEG